MRLMLSKQEKTIYVISLHMKKNKNKRRIEEMAWASTWSNGKASRRYAKGQLHPLLPQVPRNQNGESICREYKPIILISETKFFKANKMMNTMIVTQRKLKNYLENSI